MAANSLELVIKLLVETGSTASSINAIKKAFLGLSTAIGTLSIADAFVEANREVEKLLRGLNAISTGRGDAYFERLANSAERIGIPIKEVSQSFLELNAATKGTSFEGTKTQAIFEGLANALSTTGADAVRFNRGFRALGQILSKDQLFAEELRQQLGEALPTAIQDFARALQISPAQLFKFMEQGVIKGDDLRRTLVLVTKEWQKTYKILNKADFTVDQKLALVQNQMLLLFKVIGDTGIWKAFGDAILYVEGILIEARSGIRNLDAEIKTIYKTISQFASDVKNDLGGFGEDIGNALNNVEFSPTGLIRNFKVLFQALPNEARFALQPIEDAIANIDFGKIVVGFVSVFDGARQAIGVLAASAVDWFNILINQIPELLKVPELAFNILAAQIKVVFTDVSNYISLKIEEIQNSFTKSKINVRWTQLFGSAEELNDLFNTIQGLDAEYQKSTDAAEQRSNKVQESLDAEKAKLSEVLASVKQQFSTWAATTGDSFAQIAQKIQQSFDRLSINREIERQNILLQQAGDREKQRSLFHKEYIDNLHAEFRAKNPLLVISREQAKLEQDRLKISQSYIDTVQDIKAAEYDRWAAQGQITKEGAEFLKKSAKENTAYKAWTQAQDAVDKYNEEVKKSAGVSEQEVAARKETLDALREQANQQLVYAASKANEVGNANRVTEIYKEQNALIASQEKLAKDFQKVLKNAEIKTLIVAPSEDNAKTVINDTQKKISEIKPGVVVPTTIDPATQDVVRKYEDPITKLPDATQYVKRVYSDSSGPSIPTPQRLGGPIPGYGGGDRLHYLLEPGEFVLRKEAARSIGIGQLMEMNRLGGKFNSPLIDNISLPRMASGGPVTGAPIVINVPGQKPIRLSGSRDQAVALANLLTSVGRAA